MNKTIVVIAALLLSTNADAARRHTVHRQLNPHPFVTEERPAQRLIDNPMWDDRFVHHQQRAQIRILDAPQPPEKPSDERPVAELNMGIVKPFMARAPFRTVLVGDPMIVEVNATTDKTLTLLPVKPGITNMILLNEKGEQIEETLIWVRDGSTGQGRVKIYKRADGYRAYRCGPVGCEQYDEVFSREPVPPPPQVTKSISTTTRGIDENGNPMTTTRSQSTTQ